MPRVATNPYIKAPGYLELFHKKNKPKQELTPLEIRQRFLQDQQKRSMKVSVNHTFEQSQVQSQKTIDLALKIQDLPIHEKHSFFTGSQDSMNSINPSEEVSPIVQGEESSNKELKLISSVIKNNSNRISIAQHHFSVTKHTPRLTDIIKQSLTQKLSLTNDHQSKPSSERNEPPPQVIIPFEPYQRVPLMNQHVNLDNLHERSKLTSFIRSISISQEHSPLNRTQPSHILEGKSQVSMILQQSMVSDFEFHKYSLSRSFANVSSGKKKIFS